MFVGFQGYDLGTIHSVLARNRYDIVININSVMISMTVKLRTIAIAPKTKEQLDEIGCKGETYNQIIQRLLGESK